MSFYGSDYDFSDYMDATDYYNSQSENFSQEFYTYESQSCNMLEIQNILKKLSAHCKSFRVPKQSVHQTRVKVSRKISKSPALAPLVITPISVPPPSSEISVTLTIDSSTISNLPTDEESPRVPHANFDFPCLAECVIGVNSLSAVDAESKVEEEIPALVVPVDEYTKEEDPLSPMHAPWSAEYFSPFSIIPTVQVFQDLFRSCTLHQFELGRDPPVLLNFAHSKFGFGLVQKFKDLFYTCTLDQFDLGRDPLNVLDIIGDSCFGFG